MAALPFGITISRTKPAPPGTPSPARPARDEFDEIGVTGTQFYSGFLDAEEYNSDLQGQKAIAVYDKMLRSDGMIGAMLLSIVLPIQGAIPKLDPASEDERDILIARTVEHAITNMAGQIWDDVIRQAVTGLVGYGHAVFEKVFVMPDGKPNLLNFEGEQILAPYKLAPRLQKTIYRWHIDWGGELLGIQQRAFAGTLDPSTVIQDGSASAGTYGSTGTWKFIDINASRLLVFTLQREGSNYAGLSLLRRAYKHFYYKDALLRIGAVSAERHGVGVPYAIVKQGLAKAEENALIAALRSLHSHEKGYLLVSESQLADGQKLGMNPIGIMDMRAQGVRQTDSLIQYHDRQMAMSILADYLTLGSGIGGNANVMHRDKSSLFFNALRGIVTPIEQIIQRDLIRQIVDLNWSGVTKYPTFRLTSLETKDFERLGRSVAMMATAGLITPDPELEDQLREMMDFPLLPEDEEGDPMYPLDAKIPANPKVLPGAPPAASIPDTSQPAPLSEVKPPHPLAAGPWKRELRASEKHTDYTEISSLLDAGQKRLAEAGLPAAKDMAAMIAAGRQPGPEQWQSFSLAVQPVLRDVYHHGRQMVLSERQRARGRHLAGPPELPPGDLSKPGAFDALGRAMGERVGGRLRDFWVRLVGTSVDEPAIMRTALMQHAGDAADAVAGYSVSTPLNQGRSDEAKVMADEIAYAERSALLDKATCDSCEALDGEQYGVDSPEYDENEPPAQCEGGGNCFPAGTEVSGQFVGGFKAWYSGQMIELRTASGRNLSVTPNHPILTTKGFIRAGSLQEGDEVISQAWNIVESTAVDVHNRPALIEGVFDLLRGSPAFAIHTHNAGSGYLHGDGASVEGKIEVVTVEGELLGYTDSASPEAVGEFVLIAANGQPENLPGMSSCAKSQVTIMASPTRLPGRAEELFRISTISPTLIHRVGTIAHIDSRLYKPAGEDTAIDTAFGRELFQRFAADVTHDEIIEVGQVNFAGHVYDLSTVGGWYLANGIIASNCRCVYVYLWSDEASMSEPRLLAQARCPTCRRKVGENVNPGASLYCPRCHDRFVVGGY